MAAAVSGVSYTQTREGVKEEKIIASSTSFLGGNLFPKLPAGFAQSEW